MNTKDGWGWADPNAGGSFDGANLAGLQKKTNKGTGGNQTASPAGNVTPAVPYTCLINCSNDSEVYSFHMVGAMILMSDASVRFLSENVGSSVVSAIMSMNRGDKVGEF